jgi:hypothetical protein
MLVRPGRLLPSVIVGALVTGALALGAGAASAEERCVLGLQSFPVGGNVTEDGQGRCLLDGETPTLGELLSVVTGTVEAVVTPPEPVAPSTTRSATQSTRNGASEGAEATSGGSQGRQAAEQDQRAAQQRAQQEAAQRAAADAAQRAAQAQAARVVPAAPAAAPGGLAAGVPALSFGTPNPALLLVPPGSPLRTLAGQDEGARVTTTSDVQAMAFDNLPGGMGTPAVIGVLILSTLGAFALRHRVLRRARTTAASSS